MKEFLLNLIRKDTQERMSSFLLLACSITVILLCTMVTVLFFVTGKDFSSQCALLSGLMLTIPSVLKGYEKGKESKDT
jgi:hypothetical protein